MPIYEYKCNKCEKSFEHLLRSISEKAPNCPECGASNPEKQLSVFSAPASFAGGMSDVPCGVGAGCPSGGCAGGGGGCPLG